MWICSASFCTQEGARASRKNKRVIYFTDFFSYTFAQLQLFYYLQDGVWLNKQLSKTRHKFCEQPSPDILGASIIWTPPKTSSHAGGVFKHLVNYVRSAWPCDSKSHYQHKLVALRTRITLGVLYEKEFRYLKFEAEGKMYFLKATTWSGNVSVLGQWTI